MPATRADVCAVRHESDKGVIPAFSLSLLDEGVNEWIALKPNAKRKRRSAVWSESNCPQYLGLWFLEAGNVLHTHIQSKRSDL